MPDFGDRFWVYAMYDARTDQFGELGKPYGTKPGFYLLVGPKWKGEKPAGIKRSSAVQPHSPTPFRACSWTTLPRTSGRSSR